MVIDNNHAKTNMKFPRRKQATKRPILIILGGVFVAVLGGILLWQMWPNSTTPADTTIQGAAPTNTVDYDPPTAEEKAEQEAQKTKLLEGTTGDGSTSTTPPDANLTITITRAGQATSGQPVSVRTIVSGTASGTCEATFNRAGSSFTKIFPVAVSASTVTCNGDVELDTFSSGEWQMSIIVKNGSGASQPAIATFTVTP